MPLSSLPTGAPSAPTRRSVLRGLAALPLTASLAASLTACVGGPAAHLAAAGPAPGTPEADGLHVVTSRRLVGNGQASPFFDARRAPELTYARASFRRPDGTVAGRLGALVSSEAALERVDPYSGDAVERLAEVLRGRDSLFFVHGYNQTFEAAARDLAQLSAGIGFSGHKVLFSWPSKGGLLDYGYDRESALLARDHLAEALYAVLGDAEGRRVHLVAHSMGTLVTLEALRAYRDRYGETGLERVGSIVFAAPDIDVDMFKAGLMRLGPLRRKLMVITATNDRALDLSSRLSGGQRVGALSSTELVGLGVRVVDATEFASGLTRHDAFVSNADVRAVIQRAIERS